MVSGIFNLRASRCVAEACELNPFSEKEGIEVVGGE